MDDIKKLDDYELYSAYFMLKNQMLSDAEIIIEGFGSCVKTRLFTANEHLPHVLSLMKIEREMIARGLTP